MTAEEHNKTLSTLYYIYAAIHGLTLIGLLLLVLVVRMAAPVADLISTFWLSISIVIFLIIFLAVGLIPLLVGYGFQRRAGWVKPLAIGLAVVSMVNIPIGTALGIYTIKFLRSNAGAQLYGGQATFSSAQELTEAMQGAKPLMNWADRLK